MVRVQHVLMGSKMVLKLVLIVERLVLMYALLALMEYKIKEKQVLIVGDLVPVVQLAVTVFRMEMRRASIADWFVN